MIMIFFLAQNIWLDVRLTKQPFVATCNFVEKVLEVLCSLECSSIERGFLHIARTHMHVCAKKSIFYYLLHVVAFYNRGA